MYSPIKTFTKTVEPPLLILLLTYANNKLKEKVGIEITEEQIFYLSSSLYGIFKGIINFLKNKNKK